MHTFSKVFWKTGGKIKSVPVYTPFNQLNLQSNDSYISNIKAKWLQTLRHAYGIHEVSYALNEFSTAKKVTLRGLAFTFNLMDALLIHNCFTVPIVAYAQVFMYLWENTENAYLRSQIDYFHYSSLFTLFLNVICLLTYEIYKRYTNARFYNKPNTSWLRFFEFVVFPTVGIFGFIFPTFLIAAFRGFFTNLEYKVSQKKLPTSLKTMIKKND